MKHVQKILQKEMTRKEFFATLGFGLATVAGFSSLLNMLGKTNNPWQQAASSNTKMPSYGGGPYGGAGDGLSRS